jgi:hypothetical protein
MSEELDIIPAEVIEEPKEIVRVDRSATALAAAARASIQARVMLAMQCPRSIPRVQDIVLSQMKRPSLAERAIYRIERGKKQNEHGQWEPNFVEGASIKLANSLRMAMGNMGTEDVVVADDPDNRTIAVTAIDYETNSSETRQVVVTKTVERKGFKGKAPDRDILGSRRNSYGDTVYICRATEAEIQEMSNSACARARRNAILALVPADIVEDAIAIAKSVMSSTAAKQRVSTVSRLKTKFAKMGVTQQALADYLGKSIDEATAEDLTGLDMLANAVADGHTTWKSALQSRQEAAETTEEDSGEKALASPLAKIIESAKTRT